MVPEPATASVAPSTHTDPKVATEVLAKAPDFNLLPWLFIFTITTICFIIHYSLFISIIGYQLL